VLAILMVFLFHASSPFLDLGEDWIVMNPQRSIIATALFGLLASWGMPFFFLLAGAGAWFALRRRTARQYAGERFRRLLIPFLAGSILLTPLQNYFDWKYWTSREAADRTYLQFFLGRWEGANPTIFSWIGYHLWFLGFLFLFALIALRLFAWLKGPRGQASILRLAGLCDRRGGILAFILPLTVIELGLRPFFPGARNWADFVLYLAFFILGYILYADARFARSIWRDRWILFAGGVAAMVVFLIALASGSAHSWFDTPAMPGFYLFWFCAAVSAWCWNLFMLFLGMRYLNFSNPLLQYGQAAIVPFYVFHQPMIVIIAYYAVQWSAGVTVKMLIVIVGSLLVTLAIYELLIRRVALLRPLFGMKRGV
jgi:glucans biosynthesis protein C